MKENIIYVIKNLITNDIYVGSSVNFTYRKWCHIRDLNNNKHHSPILQNSWNKYGKNNFIFEIIKKVKETNNLIQQEQHYIDILKPRYNISKTAGSPLGVKHTKESRKNMSIAHLGKKLSPESIKKRSLKQKGLKRSKLTIQRMINGAKNKIPISQYTMNNKFIKNWKSASEAARKLNISQPHISQCCKNAYGRKSIGGYKWKYKI